MATSSWIKQYKLRTQFGTPSCRVGARPYRWLPCRRGGNMHLCVTQVFATRLWAVSSSRREENGDGNHEAETGGSAQHRQGTQDAECACPRQVGAPAPTGQ